MFFSLIIIVKFLCRCWSPDQQNHLPIAGFVFNNFPRSLAVGQATNNGAEILPK